MVPDEAGKAVHVKQTRRVRDGHQGTCAAILCVCMCVCVCVCVYESNITLLSK